MKKKNKIMKQVYDEKQDSDNVYNINKDSEIEL